MRNNLIDPLPNYVIFSNPVAISGSEDGVERDTITGTPQGGLCAAAHNPPYEQRWVMHSVDPSTLVKVGVGVERCT